MSTRTPTQYAEELMTLLHTADGNTARTALSIAGALVEHRIICEAGVAFRVAAQEGVPTSASLPPEASKLGAVVH
jgi:hypothetical protein